MNICKQTQEKLALFVYGDLSGAEQDTVRAHLESCPDCSREVERLQALQEVLPPQPPLPADEATLIQLRNSLSQKLRQGQQTERRSFVSFWELLQPAPALRIGMAVLLFVVGFFVGRQGPADTPVANDLNKDAMEALFTANNLVQTGGSAINPLLASVERIKYNPDTGEMEIFYTTVNDIHLKGNMQNPAVQQMLREAILEEENLAVRLHAVKAVKSMAVEQNKMAPEILDALTYVLKKEENPGVRLKVVQALKALLPDESVKVMLVKILLDDPNPALRIEALSALMENEISIDDVNLFRKVARQDSNNYIRNRAHKMLDEYDNQAIPGSGRTDESVNE